MNSWDLTEDQAITLLTVACDFNIHQVCANTFSLEKSCVKLSM